MANKGLFKTLVGKLIPQTHAVNSEFAPAYAFSAKHALAQYAATGCMNTTFYASAEDQLETVLKLAQEVEPEFVAKVALFCRTKGYMKDLPALLCAVLSVRSPGLLAEVFDRVIDSPKMLRNFVQIMRSGQVGRKSLGTLPKRLVVRWIENRTDEQLFSGSVLPILGPMKSSTTLGLTERTRPGHRLHAQPVGSTEDLHHPRLPQHRQQRRRTRPAAGGDWQEELAFRWP
jgi:60 kDa SS-A/Ro ribonucleoprotein